MSTTTSATNTTRWTRAFVAAGVGWFVCWQLLVAAGYGRQVGVTVGIYGFVLHVVFGKAYALVPSYFDRSLAIPWAPALQFPFTVVGTVLLVIAAAGIGTRTAIAGAALWCIGVGVFLVAVVWTVRDNLTGSETGTGTARTDRRGTDRIANAFVPVALVYLAAGAILPLASHAGVVGSPADPAYTHLLAAGTAALLIFALGFRLLPRFLVVDPGRIAPLTVLSAGAVAPALLAVDFRGGIVFRIGAGLQAVAVVGFALAYADMYRRSDKSRIGFPIVLLGALAGVVAVLVGLHVAFVGIGAGLVDVHVRFASLGFLGLVVVGVSYQFYPPSIGTFPGVGDRLALGAAGSLLTGLLIESAGLVAGTDAVTTAGRSLTAVGAVGYAYVVLSLFVQRALD